MATTKKSATITSKKPSKAAAKSTPKTAPKAIVAKPISKTDKLAAFSAANLTPKPHLTGFIDFLREQSVVGLAIGLVIGTQTKALADQLIASFINPLIGLALPGQGTLNQKTFTLHVHSKSAMFAWGSFMATLLSFITTAIVVYVVFKSLKLDRLTKKKA
ncbi:MAG: MscL family protein [Candidatus Saccharibacteria bacterium]|jgi:large-conductance mechanosensitive channel